MAREREKLLKEYESRLEREEQLKKVEQEMNIQKALMVSFLETITHSHLKPTILNNIRYI